jgi:hypothetical protein
MAATRRRRPAVSDEQPALDFDVPEPVSADERIAREEIDRFYADRVKEAEEAYAKAADALAAASRLYEAWCETGTIVPVHPGKHPNRLTLTVREIADDSQNRYTAAMQDLIRPVMRAPTTAVAESELRRLRANPETATARAAADALGDRAKVLCRWLISQGHDIGPWSVVLDEDVSRTGKPRKRR